ncbi:MAG TPA: lysophospholipid acyltransferase family protein [Pyrinomonadaceae bacterium]|jgi:1-acyl-sn-glycerol-3-phosphate acyltransferase|nr:lysophospholipid acyltransferase family protein [Pyrinomonadaceae bacterium]
MLPQWALEIIRPAARSLSHLLWRVDYEGTENVPLHGGVIIAANHQSYIDPFWISVPIKRTLRYLAWSESFDWPVIGKLMKLFGAWPLEIERSDPTAIRRSLQWLRRGGAVVIFPEGGRCRPDGALMRFKNGAVRMALEANVPILPVTIRGAHRVWPKGYRLPHLAKVEVIYHPLHHIRQHEGEDTRACARRESGRLAEIIATKL